jgi:hypothetical protein
MGKTPILREAILKLRRDQARAHRMVRRDVPDRSKLVAAGLIRPTQEVPCSR